MLRADTPYILEGLEAHRTYQFRFAAINDVGSSDWGSIEQRTMPKRSAPEEPKILVNKDVYTDDYINSPYGNSYELNWKIPADNGEPIDFFSVHFCIVSMGSVSRLKRDCFFFSRFTTTRSKMSDKYFPKSVSSRTFTRS